MEKIIQKLLNRNIPILAGGQNVKVMMIAQVVRNVIVEFAVQHLLQKVVVKINVVIEDMETFIQQENVWMKELLMETIYVYLKYSSHTQEYVNLFSIYKLLYHPF